MVCEKRKAWKGCSKNLNLKKYGRHWYREDLAVEVPSAILTGSQERLTRVEINGLAAYVIGGGGYNSG